MVSGELYSPAMNPAAAYMLLKGLGNTDDDGVDLPDSFWTLPRLTVRRALKWLAFSLPSLVAGAVVGYLIWRHTGSHGPYQPATPFVGRVWVMFLCCTISMGAVAVFITPLLYYGGAAAKRRVRALTR